jgi:hypothetical protein
MDRQEALRAITILPAQICGIEDRVGSIAVGKVRIWQRLTGNLWRSAFGRSVSGSRDGVSGNSLDRFND